MKVKRKRPKGRSRTKWEQQNRKLPHRNKEELGKKLRRRKSGGKTEIDEEACQMTHLYILGRRRCRLCDVLSWGQRI
jgi:hypothetical protein